MFHFNRSLEGDFAANDMGRCDGVGEGSETHKLTVPHATTETEGGDEGEAVGGGGAGGAVK